MTLTFDSPASRIITRGPSSSRAIRQYGAPDSPLARSLRDQPVADAFVVLTAPLADQAFRQTELMAERADAELLDSLRDTLQRLRALWWAFEPLLDEKEARVVRKRFKHLADIAGEPHELDTACDLLTRARKTCSRVGPVVRTLKEERREASTASCVIIRRANVDALLRRALADARRRLEARTEDSTLEAFARQRVMLADETLSRREQRAAKMKHVDAKTLRSIEEAARKLKCLLEMFAPVLERGHLDAIGHLADAQAALGRLGDLLASEALVRRVALTLDDKHAVDLAVQWLDRERRGESRAALKRLRAIPHHI
jgi:CHAD domain-containing protein